MKEEKGKSKKGKSKEGGVLVTMIIKKDELWQVLYAIHTLLIALKKLKAEDRIYKHGIKAAQSPQLVKIMPDGSDCCAKTPIADVVISHLVDLLKYTKVTSSPDEIDRLISTAEEFLAFFGKKT